MLLLNAGGHVGRMGAIGNAGASGYAVSMERHEFPVRGEAEEWVAAVERGDEVVLTRDGKVVATVQPTGSDLPQAPGIVALLRAREALAPLRSRDAWRIIREQRDASAH